MNPPDRRTDDLFFAQQIGEAHGARSTAAGFMNTSCSSVTQQFDPDNHDKSYFHCGALSLYAADMMDAIDGGARGDALWQRLAESRAGWLNRGARSAPRRPAPELHTLSFLCGKFVNVIVARLGGQGGDEDVRSAARRLHAALGTYLDAQPKAVTPIHAGRGASLERAS